MLRCGFIFLTLVTFIVSPLPASAGQVQGKVTTYTSPAGITEQCIALAPMPGGRYRAGDREQEQHYCNIDFYDPDIALCPKIWSTSPGTIIYDLSRSSFAGRVRHFEQNECSRSKEIKKLPVTKLAKLKTTMNGKKTSGTFSTSSLLYYHFSRYFDTLITVPVAVWRSLDRKIHLQRVTAAGVRLTSHNRMLHEGWLKLAEAEKNPASYHPMEELFTDDKHAVYGILINSPGHRYRTTVNGTRSSGWGEGQNRDFQETAPYLALRSEKPLAEAVRHGLRRARANNKMKRDLAKNISPAQMVFWMTELTEITLLDYIFSQQDRIGNIDYIPYWYWQENGEVHRKKAHGTKVPAELADKSPLLLKRTQLNDNDAGGRIEYINYTRKTQMLEKQRHYRAATYKRLLQLTKDFTAQGTLYQYVRDTFGLSEKQLRQIIRNTADAADILRKNCRNGKLRFDLEPYEFLRTGQVVEQRIDCDKS